MTESDLDPLERTALWTASMRAREHRRSDRLFHDPLAETLAGDVGQRIMLDFEGVVQAGEEDPALAVRTRYFDEEMERVVAGGVRQVALLGAGMDTRFWRLSHLDGVTVFEVDRPSLLHHKHALLSGQPPPHGRRLVFIPADLTSDELVSVLAAAGLDFHLPVMWLIEGVLYFLTAGDSNQLLNRLSNVSVAGSALLGDYVSNAYLASPDMAGWREQMAKNRHPWKSGHDNPCEWLGSWGWTAQVTAYGIGGVDYGRWREDVNHAGAGPRGRYVFSATKR